MSPPSRVSRWRCCRLLLLVLAGLVGIDWLVYQHRDIWKRYSPDDYQERLDACRSQPRDVVVVGGSPVSEGIDPAHLAGLNWRGRPIESVYALGLPGGTTSECWHAVIHGTAPPPRLLIYGVTASDLNDARHEPHGPYSLMDWGDLVSWVKARPDSAEWVTRHFLQARLAQSWQLFRYRHGIRLWLAIQAEEYFPGTFPEIIAEAHENLAYTQAIREGNGYAPNVHFVNRRYEEWKKAGYQPDKFHFLEKYRIGAHLGYLRRMLDWANRHGTDVVLVDMPVTDDLEQLYIDEFHLYRAALANLGDGHRVRVLWADRDLGLTDRDFSDLIHLNHIGATKLSRWIRTQLETDEMGR